MASLREFELLSYDRVGTPGTPRPDAACYTVERHADDAAEILRSRGLSSAAVVGSSFGAVVALDLARRYPILVKTLVICEPPLAESDSLAAVPDGFACRFDALTATQGGPAAAEYFLRSVLGDAAFEHMPSTYQSRSKQAWQQIRSDMSALSRYRVRYDDLAEEIRCPVLLLSGTRSAAFFRDTLDSLHMAIPGSELRVLAGAGHMMQVDAHRQFNEAIRSVVPLS